MSLSELLTWRKPKRLTKEEYLQKLTEKGLHADGTPVLDPLPIAPPIGYVKAPSMVEIVRDMVRGERLRQEAEAAGYETFEESEDFDVGDEDVHARSPYENEFDPPIGELLAAGREEVAKKESAAKAAKTSKKPAEEPAGDVGGGGGSPPPEDAGTAS